VTIRACTPAVTLCVVLAALFLLPAAADAGGGSLCLPEPSSRVAAIWQKLDMVEKAKTEREFAPRKK